MRRPFTQEQHEYIAPRIVVIAFAAAMAALLYYFKSIWSGFTTVLTIISPFLAGFAIAFMLSPVQRFLDRCLLKTLFRKSKRHTLMHALTGLLSLIFLVALVSTLLSFVGPQLYNSIRAIVRFVSNFLRENEVMLNSILAKVDFLNIDGDSLALAWDNIVANQLNNVAMLLSNVLEISGSVLSVLYRSLISLITAFYIMMGKEILLLKIRKLGYSMLRRDTMETLVYWVRRASLIFTGFISGKVLDSLIIGLICYVFMLIVKMPFAVLVSCIIAVTNIIPFFGPFIGWLPSALILLIVHPLDAVWFSVFILILQQVDGNIIGPHILGDSVGVSAFSIMVVIVIGSGLFGFIGMLLAVPVYALIDAVCQTVIDARLKRKGMSTELENYTAEVPVKETAEKRPSGKKK